MARTQDTHTLTMGYLLWIFGFMGAHRFYYGRPITGTIWFLTLGLFFVGWIVDLFLIPRMEREADLQFVQGSKSYDVAWVLLTFLGVFGAHRFYMEKWVSGIVYLLSGGLLLLGVVWDYWTLNGQLADVNRRARSRSIVPTEPMAPSTTYGRS